MNLVNTYYNSRFTRMRYLLPLPVVAMALLAGTTSFAQDKTSEIDKIFSWASASTPGCVCAVSQQGKVSVNRAYGQADLERNVPLSAHSVFDVASLQKQFIAAAVLLLVEEGRLTLSDDVRKHIPELPDYGQKITVDHLLTHTSGLRDWTGIMPLANGNPDALTLILRQRGLNFAPGEEWGYSNSGYVLLKEMITRISGMTVDAFTRKRLFEPLGMQATQYLSDLREVVQHRALAYDKQGSRWKLDMKLDNDRGGGGALLSTAGDLLIWNEALASGRLGTFVIEKLQEPARLNNGRQLGYARGLFLDSNRGGKVVWHTGGSSGYGSILARFPEQGLSLAILCNSGDAGDRTAASRRIFDLFVPSTDTSKSAAGTPLANEGESANTAPDLAGKAGLFLNERTGQPLRLVLQNGRLRIAGGPVLHPVDKDRFRNPNGALSFMSGDAFELYFSAANKLELKSMEGKTTVYRRAQHYAPTAADLQAFAGRYQSNEIGGYFDISATEKGLMGKVNDAPGPGFALQPIDPDTFQLGGVIVHFRRDKQGKVAALEYSNPLVRKVLFSRVEQRTAGL